MLLGCSTFSLAHSIAPSADSSYTVQEGDTLWQIAKALTGKPLNSYTVERDNSNITNPQQIFPGDRISLVKVNGEKRLKIQSAVTTEATQSQSIVKLSPKVRTEPLAQSKKTVPYAAIRPYLKRTVLLEKQQLEGAPYVVAMQGLGVLAGTGDYVYVSNMGAQVAQLYNVVRAKDVIADPDNKSNILGYKGVVKGVVSLKKEGEPTTFAVTESYQELEIGDLLIPMSEGKVENFYPKNATHRQSSRILSVFGGISNIGRGNVIVIEGGDNSRSRISVGDVLAVYQDGKVIKDAFAKTKGREVILPEESAGEVMVFRTYATLSLAVVLKAKDYIAINDRLANY